ncbi:DNA-binding response regulator [Paractinoplanes deccanensis]|uniref:DNA-binding response regulator n=1 Tax=Paractinoplanes deccanensis TaxID=113561 RepID=A0ABQ3YB56_9ACTN|nr:response regulator transcription factor [Actinoplanes deccanensis]GID77239.1 DNA-binding response regulator [Actinoplanes deccanensis]
MNGTLRVVVADDHTLVREGMVRVLEQGGVDVLGTAATADGLLGQARAYRPDVVVTDLHMPPGDGRDGMWAARELRRGSPACAVVVVSQYLEEEFALELVEAGPTGVGYLLKQKIAVADTLLDAVRRVAAGGTALDPDVISGLVRRGRDEGPLGTLTAREREVLTLMAEGHSNAGIAARLFITVPAVERHVTGIFAKLGLGGPGGGRHRRVQAVLHYLRSTCS